MKKLSQYSQENILALLTWDNKNCILVRNSITAQLFDSPYQELVVFCIKFIDKYKLAIGEHIADEMESLLAGPQGEKYREILVSLYHVKDKLNNQYITEKLTEFIRAQKFSESLYDAAALHNQGKIDEAQEVMRLGMQFNLELFDPGIKLTDLNLLQQSLNDEDLFPTGITALDDMKVGPARRQLLVYLAVRASGKSWYCVQCAKMAILQGYKVVHVTLEISKEIALQRYLQAMFGLSRWHYDELIVPSLEKDGNGNFKGIKDNPLRFYPRSMEEEDILDHLSQKIKDMGPRISQCLYLKEYPSGQLSLPQLRGYLDSLETTVNFIPDMLIVDMPRNMSLPVKDFRLEMDQLYIGLRGLAVERNMAVIAPHQINREGAKSTTKFITGEHISEDWNILGTADTGLIYNQKPSEHKQGLARLYVDRARSMRSQFTVLMSQSYESGQYCVESVMSPDDYDPINGFAEAKPPPPEPPKPRPRAGKIVVVPTGAVNESRRTTESL